MFEAAIGTALCFIALMFYLDIKKIAGFAAAIDIIVFALFIWMFKGTYAGMMTGIIAGLIITGFLRTVRASFGYKKVALKRKKGQLVPMPRWVDVPPKYRR